MSERRDLAAIYDAVTSGVVVHDARGSLVFANAAARRIFAAAAGWLFGSDAGAERARLREDGTRMPYDEVPNVVAHRLGQTVRNVVMGSVAADGSVQWLLVEAVPIMGDDGRVREVVSSLTDVTERKLTEDLLERRAFYDPVTDLPNRSLLEDRVAQAEQSARMLGTSVALLLVGIDDLDGINDRVGRAAGDLLLVDAATRMQAQLREQDSLSRFGADMFAVLLPGADEAGAQQVARKLLAALRHPFEVAGGIEELSASIGIACHPAVDAAAGTLLHRAGLASESAANSTSAVAVHNGFAEPFLDRRALAAGLRGAIERGELTIAFQPIVRIADDRAVGVEALARWPRVRRKAMDAGKVAALAERCGLTRVLFARTLRTALEQSATWRRSDLALDTGVNLLIGNLLDAGLPALVESALRETGASSGWLTLEVAENALTVEPERARETIRELVGIGCHIAVDDFGVGYSSLPLLQGLSAEILKIDRSLVERLAAETENRRIVRIAVEIGHSLGMQVVANGVKNVATLDVLAGLGCDLAQGTAVSGPIAGAAIPPWIGRTNRTNSGA
ncbi:MAG TPA: GGDEF domain-containing protein [Candidatus Limnocylindria bacterium]|nr:GGDEF domain-containing protein [Candidatus Limnocylindria bacterium]